jgi:hypothetical protein
MVDVAVYCSRAMSSAVASAPNPSALNTVRIGNAGILVPNEAVFCIEQNRK